MAQLLTRPYTPVLFLLFIIAVIRLTRGNTLLGTVNSNNPNVTAINLLNVRDVFNQETHSFISEYLIELCGTGLESNLSLRWSNDDSDCERDVNVLKNVWISMSGDSAIYTFMKLPDTKENRIYFCLKYTERWTNLGNHFTINLPSRLQ